MKSDTKQLERLAEAGHQIAESIRVIRDCAVMVAEREVGHLRRKPDLIVVDTLTSLEQAVAHVNTDQPGYAWVPQSDLALVCRVLRQMLKHL